MIIKAETACLHGADIYVGGIRLFFGGEYVKEAVAPFLGAASDAGGETTVLAEV